MLKPFSRESEIRKKEKLQEKNQRKRRKIIRASFEPLLPGLIRMVYLGMIVLPFCSVAVELIACLEHKNDGTWELFWKNSRYSYFFCWLFLGVVTAALCVIQIVRTEKFGYSERIYRFADEILYAELSLYQKANNPEGEEDDDLALYEREPEIPTKNRYRNMLIWTATFGAAAGLYYGLSRFLM